jgi:hypothetical protein
VETRDFTVADMLARAAGNPSAEIVVELLLIPDYPHFVRLMNKAIDMSFRRMSENPELRKDRDEDELTIELVTLLRQLSIDATHETKVGGHCDVTIRGQPDYLWLAEAKQSRPPPSFTGPRVRHRKRGGAPGSFGQPRFPQTFNDQLRVCLPAPSDPG